MYLRSLLALTVAVASVTLLAVMTAATGGDDPFPAPHLDKPRLFETADACMSCHNVLTTPSGEDVSIGTAWRATMMANSARDPYWQASVRREVLDHPQKREEIEDECAKCHMPMMRFQAHADGRKGEVLARLPIGASSDPDNLLAADGVSCTLCHQILDEKLGQSESFSGGFAVDIAQPWRKRSVFGPFQIDAGRARIMHSSSEFLPKQGMHIRKSELCATCHTLYTEALDANGKVAGRFPEQVPFQEWKHSGYVERQSCQACHMPVVAESVAIAGVWGQPRSGMGRHDFRGGNFFMLRMLNRYRVELGVEALPQELDAAARRTAEHLQSQTARVTIEDAQVTGGRLRVLVSVNNLTGHKLPTAYPSRRVWLHLTVRDRDGKVVFESGAIDATGAIRGNDNDSEELSYEPHYREIDRPDQVQIYESILEDSEGRVTTGLLSAVRFAKDNRLLPVGFNKASAAADIAVRGPAAEDADFAGGGDRVRYAVDVSQAVGPFRVEAELAFQPIAFRWARNLARHEAAETRRFVSYYDAMAHASSVAVARHSTTTR